MQKHVLCSSMKQYIGQYLNYDIQTGHDSKLMDVIYAPAGFDDLDKCKKSALPWIILTTEEAIIITLAAKVDLFYVTLTLQTFIWLASLFSFDIFLCICLSVNLFFFLLYLFVCLLVCFCVSICLFSVLPTFFLQLLFIFTARPISEIKLPGKHFTVASKSWLQAVYDEEWLQLTRRCSLPLHATYLMWIAPCSRSPNREGVSSSGRYIPPYLVTEMLTTVMVPWMSSISFLFTTQITTTQVN